MLAKLGDDGLELLQKLAEINADLLDEHVGRFILEKQ
jgi:hypothetical protein